MDNKAPAPQLGFRRKPGKKRLAVVAVLSLGLAGVFGAAGLFYIKTFVPITNSQPYGEGGKKTAEFSMTHPGESTFRGLERMNILVLGIDNNYTAKDILYTRGARSDSMMIVSINNEAKFLNVLSIPRDTQVLISEKWGYEKINAAFSFGGPQQAMRTVERFLHIPIHHYLVVRIQGAKKVIDALGGLKIDVEKNMDYDDNWGHLHVHLKKGIQTLTGEQAVGYARFRKDEEGDRGRMRRQQQVIRCMVELLKSDKVVKNFNKLAKAVKETLETDLETGEMIDLANLYRKFDRKAMRTGQIEGDDAMINGVSMILPYPPQNAKIVRSLLKDDADLSLHDVRIRVLNGTKDPGAGQRLADLLNGDGLQVVKIDSADRSDYKKTEVTEFLKNVRMHGRLSGLLVGATFKQANPPKGQDYDITIVLGNDRTAEALRTAPPPPVADQGTPGRPEATPRQWHNDGEHPQEGATPEPTRTAQPSQPGLSEPDPLATPQSATPHVAPPETPQPADPPKPERPADPPRGPKSEPPAKPETPQPPAAPQGDPHPEPPVSSPAAPPEAPTPAP